LEVFLAGIQSLFSSFRTGGFSRATIGNWIVIALAALCIALAANLFWVIFGPVGSIGNWKARTAVSLPAETRVALFGSHDPFSRAQAQSSDQVFVTSLSLTLFGTRVNENSGSGSAILAGADGVQQSYAVGEEVMPGVQLVQVAYDHVVLSRNGAKESLFLDQSVPAATVAPNATPSAPAPAATTGSPSGEVKLSAVALRDSISAQPRNEGGRITGIILSAKDDGAMLGTAGLMPGDIVVTINGRPVGAASDIAAQFRPGAKLTLEVERGSQKLPFGLNLE
jgi:general secretion pathway protein C